ncbi:MAG: c-type cytochrome [Candidatus Aquicultor sp.]
MKKIFLGMVVLLIALLVGCAQQTTQSTTTSTSETEAQVPETPPPSDVAALKNPLGVTAANIAAGKVMYDRTCWICHGSEGKGNGPAASHMPQEPINFTSDHDFQTMNDGEVWWIITKGVNGTDMPNWETTFNENEIWQIESYIIQFRKNENDRKGFGTAGATTTSSVSGSTTTSGGGATTSSSAGTTSSTSGTTTTTS